MHLRAPALVALVAASLLVVGCKKDPPKPAVEDAAVVLIHTQRRASDAILKCLNSAVANAEHNFALDREELFVAEAFADEGPTIKRWRPRARGRATRIRKRTSHITIVVADDEESA